MAETKSVDISSLQSEQVWLRVQYLSERGLLRPEHMQALCRRPDAEKLWWQAVLHHDLYNIIARWIPERLAPQFVRGAVVEWNKLLRGGRTILHGLYRILNRCPLLERKDVDAVLGTVPGYIARYAAEPGGLFALTSALNGSVLHGAPYQFTPGDLKELSICNAFHVIHFIETLDTRHFDTLNSVTDCAVRSGEVERVLPIYVALRNLQVANGWCDSYKAMCGYPL